MRTTLVVVVAATMLAGCGDGTTPERARALPAEALGACSKSGDLNAADPATFMSKPGAWLRVESVDVQSSQPGDVTTDFRGSYVVVGGDEEMTAPLGTAPDSLKMHGSIARAAAEALLLGAHVHAHTGVADNPRHVAFALAVKDGEFAFLGDCQHVLLTEPMARQLGPSAADRLSGLVGKRAAELRSALVRVPAQPSPRDVLLNPEVTSREVLDKLDGGMFSVTAPESWRGQHTLCTRIAAGWGDCIDLSSPETATISVNYYFDPADPKVEVWLLDSAATVSRPIVRLAALDLGALAKRDRVDLGKPGVNVSVTLASTPSLSDVLRDHAKAQQAVARARVARG